MKKRDYILRSDLALQNKKYKIIDTKIYDNIRIKTYSYHNNIIKDILLFNYNNCDKLIIKLIISEIKFYLKKYNIKKQDSVLVVGLGNSFITSDSLGVRVVSKVKANGYLNINSNIRKVYTYIPGVMEQSGYMAFDGIKALVKELKPSFVVIIDSLLCDEIKHLNKIIQISDMGITPGSGIMNYQTEISLKTLGIPVFVIGVPTATFASTIIRDVTKIKKNQISFLDGYDFIVATKDIDLMIDYFSKIISSALNYVLNNIKSF